MKRFGCIGAIRCVAILAMMAWSFLAYGEQNDQAKTPGPGKTQVSEPRQGDKTWQEPGNEEKASFKADAKKAVGEIDRHIAELAKEVRKEGSNLGAEAKESWDDVKAKHKEVKKQLKELYSAGEESWTKARSGFNSALDDLRNTYKRAVSYFR